MSGDESTRWGASGLRSTLTVADRDPLRDQWRRSYWLLAGLVAVGGLLATGVRFVGRHGTGPPLPHNDSVILEYVGWFLAQGNTLYTDIWEIKPPLAFLPSSLAALVAGENMYLHHLLGIATTATALVVTVALTARITGTVTDSPLAGTAAGLTFLTLPELFYLPWLGYKAKIVVFALGLAALDRAIHGRWATSGLLAGLAVGFWQLAILFPILTIYVAVRTASRTVLARHVAGLVLGGLATLGSLLLYADIEGFLAEAVLGPLVLDTGVGAFGPYAYLWIYPGPVGVVLTVAAIAGLAVAVRDPVRVVSRPTDRVALHAFALGALLVVGVLLLDFDGTWDGVYPLVFTAIGVGVLVAALPRRAGGWAVVVLAVAVLLTTAVGPSPAIRQDPVAMQPTDGKPPALDPEREFLYWNAETVESCRFFGAGTQRSILKYYPDADTLAEAPCGQLGPPLEALGDRLPF